MNKKTPYLLIFMVGSFITGNMIGAGLLGLPIKTGPAGFAPSVAGLLALSVALFFTAVILAKEAIKKRAPVFHYPSMYGEYFGQFGKWIAIIANLIILYGLLVVYLSGSSTIIEDLLHLPVPRSVIVLVFFSLFTGVAFLKPGLILRFSTFFVCLLWISFAAIVLMGEKCVVPENLEYRNWRMLPAALPIMVMAANFHNIIPSICKKLDWNMKHIVMAFLMGSVVGFIMNVLWMQVGIGVLHLDGQGGILDALDKGLPATVPLAQAIKNPVFMEASLTFALMAIITSYISIGNTHIEFIDDLITNHTIFKGNRLLSILLAFLPPLAVSLVYPDIFLNALDIVGGIGKVILFGIFPCVIAFMGARSLLKRVFFVTPVLGLFVFILVFKVAQQLNLSWLKSGQEYWKYNFRPYTAGEAQKRKEG